MGMEGDGKVMAETDGMGMGGEETGWEREDGEGK